MKMTNKQYLNLGIHATVNIASLVFIGQVVTSYYGWRVGVAVALAIHLLRPWRPIGGK